MRKSAPIDSLLSKGVQDVLAATLMLPDKWWYLSDLAKHLDRRPSSLQGPLANLVKSGVLRCREDGNRVYYQPDPECPFLPELQGLIVKTVGLIDLLRAVLEPLEDRINVAFVYGSIARGEEGSTSDIDLITVGEAGLGDLAPALQQAEARLNRPINAMVYSRPEFAKKVAAGNHFLRAVLGKEKLFVVGTEHDLEEAAARKPRRTARDKQTRAARSPSSRRP